MNREYIGWIVAGIFVVLTVAVGAAAPDRGDVGRWQLCVGRFTAVSLNGSTSVDSVWRIDTATGETWKYVAVTDGDKQGYGWLRVTDYALNPR
jgi:hypothetical protein